ncbi:MAG: phosphate signaling complex protein PhoU [Gammaproteobacteria bacterium]|nr:phosphate signaling complex protein PhoU [Gammaproteobacteria bacterium]
MNVNKTDRHISQQYDKGLQNICSRILSIGRLVEEQVGDAVLAFTTGDLEMASSVISHEYRLNELEIHTDEESARLLALQQPVAYDLRLIVIIIKINSDLERIGDLATEIARMAFHNTETTLPKKRYKKLRNLSNQVQEILHDTIVAFEQGDAAAASCVMEKEFSKDDNYDAITHQMTKLLEKDPRDVKKKMDIMWAASALERIGDRARSICEYITILEKGCDSSFSNDNDMSKEICGDNQ